MNTLRILLLMGGCSVAFCEPVDPPTAPVSEPAAPEIEKQADPLDALDGEAISKVLGTVATVNGKVTKAFWVKESVLLITYQEEQTGYVTVSFARFRDQLDEAFDGDIASALEGKTISVTGKVVEYQYRSQIVVESADQITLLK